MIISHLPVDVRQGSKPDGEVVRGVDLCERSGRFSRCAAKEPAPSLGAPSPEKPYFCACFNWLGRNVAKSTPRTFLAAHSRINKLQRN